MQSLRAPLFFVGIAFALGCLPALDGVVSLQLALVAWTLSGLLWLLLKRSESGSAAAFYLFTICSGLAWTLILNTSIAPDDLRRLPDEKTLATTQWRGVITEEPTAQISTHASRRALDRTTFVVTIDAWRPTGGRLFGAAIDDPWQPAQGNIRCTVIGPAKELQWGDRIEFAAPLIAVQTPPVPGTLDSRAWEAAQGIYYHATVSPSDWQRTGIGGGNWWQVLSIRARDWAYERLQLGLEDDPATADFLAGMLIGYRQQIPTDIEQDFRRTGTLHVFAVSGQNVAEVIVVALILLQLCGLVRWRWAWILAPLALVYCLLTGSPSSAVRATAMALAILAAWRLGRPLNALGCWSLALLAMLVWEPALLLDPGAQLSFGIVLGLILIGVPLARRLARWFSHDPLLPHDLLTPVQRREEKFWFWATALVAATIAATLISEPITAIDFHQVTPVSALANLVVVPVAGLITAVGTMSVAVSLLNTQLAILLNNANWLFARLLIAFVGFLAHQPGASVNVPDVRALNSPTPSFIVAPLPDGACMLVRTPESAWLVNAGRENPTPSITWRLLQFYGINRLDGLVLAQMSGPDNSGAVAIARDFRPGHVAVPVLPSRSTFEKSVPEILSLSGSTLDPWQRGQHIDLAPGVRVDVLHPASTSPETRLEDRALVLLFHAEGGTLLWAGRIGPQVQADIARAFPNLHADILVMGADSPPDEDWLRSLGVRCWLVIPPRNRQLNTNTESSALSAPASCGIWPLEQTGAVDVHFPADENGQPSKVELTPWLGSPSGPN